MKNAHLLDIPDLPERAFVRHGRAIRPQGGGKGSTPKQPDYVGAAQATAQGNLEAAKYATQANRVNQYTPWGSLTWSNNRGFNQAGYDAALKAYQNQQSNLGGWEYAGNTGGGDGNQTAEFQRRSGGSSLSSPNPADFYGSDNWSQTISLSPEMQALFDQQMKLQQGLFGAQDAALGRVNQTMGTGLDTSNFQQLGDVYDPTKATNNATELLMQRLNPELDRQQDALRTQLANQGIAQGSAAYNNALSNFGQQRNDAATQAALQGIMLGMQQQGMTFGQSSQKRGQQLQEAAYLRSLPLNELNALRTGNQVSMPQFPGYAQQATTGGADILGATQAGYNSALGASNAQNAMAYQQGSGLGGLAGAGLGYFFGGPMGGLLGSGVGGALGGMFSDRRLKTDIVKVGQAGRLGVYSYRYIWGGPKMLGYMADEVEKVAPHAVKDMGGLKLVDYEAI